jgi:hypothetical protein
VRALLAVGKRFDAIRLVRTRTGKTLKDACNFLQAVEATANYQIMCPHCNVRGQVATKRVRLKQGISGGKATAAVLTAGVSLFATGLSRMRTVLEATCGNCGVTWHID